MLYRIQCSTEIWYARNSVFESAGVNNSAEHLNFWYVVKRTIGCPNAFLDYDIAFDIVQLSLRSEYRNIGRILQVWAYFIYLFHDGSEPRVVHDNLCGVVSAYDPLSTVQDWSTTVDQQPWFFLSGSRKTRYPHSYLTLRRSSIRHHSTGIYHLPGEFIYNILK